MRLCSWLLWGKALCRQKPFSFVLWRLSIFLPPRTPSYIAPQFCRHTLSSRPAVGLEHTLQAHWMTTYLVALVCFLFNSAVVVGKYKWDAGLCGIWTSPSLCLSMHVSAWSDVGLPFKAHFWPATRYLHCLDLDWHGNLITTNT